MLTDLRSVFPAAFTPEARDWDMLEVEDGARRPLRGVLFAFGVGVERVPALFLVFPTGRAGSAVAGGPLFGFGKAVAIATGCGCFRLLSKWEDDRLEAGQHKPSLCKVECRTGRL